MDYVPQEIGIYDTGYRELTEQDCRQCHGNSIADRHHGVPMVVRDHLCTPCHPICTAGSPDCQDGITVHRNCMTGGCHSWDDVRSGNKKWHHNTDMSASESCVACHDPNIVGEITPFRDILIYPPSVITPTPFSCENCHWQQPASVTGKPNAPGHPSTYQHYDEWGNLVGFYEYGRPIYSNMDTHHMDFEGNVATECHKCHSIDPNNPGWAPENPELIRYCEICHSMKTLHSIGPHVSDHDGWRPIGFHAVGSGANPITYAKWGTTPYAPQVTPGYGTNEQCYGCHGDSIPHWVDPGACTPTIAGGSDGLVPISGGCGAIAVIRGSCFGEEHIAGSAVQFARRVAGLCDWPNAQDLPIRAWNNTYIEWGLPCWTYAPGNYCVRVKTDGGNSNRVVFTVKDHPTALSVSPTSGACAQLLTISSTGGFDGQRNKMFDSYYGVSRIVDFVASAGVYTATRYASWTDTSVQVRVQDFFMDQVDTCSIDPLTGQNRNERNFAQDTGTQNLCGVTDQCLAEPTLKACDDLAIGTYSIYVKAVYFGDDDENGRLSCGDTIYQVETSDPVSFELTNDPYIHKLNPKQIVDADPPAVLSLLKIFGGNYGVAKEAGDSVRMGTKVDADDVTLGLGKEMTKIQNWSNTLIKVRVNTPNTWRGKTKYVWVEKDGKKSNSKPLKILAP
jgi:hypothetical protein